MNHFKSNSPGSDKNLSRNTVCRQNSKTEDKIIAKDNCIHIITSQKEILKVPYAKIDCLIKNGDNLLIRLVLGIEYWCKSRDNLIASLKKAYYKNTRKELVILEHSHNFSRCSEESKGNQKKRNFTVVGCGPVFPKNSKNFTIEKEAKLIYYKKEDVPLSSFTIGRQLLQKEEEAIYEVNKGETIISMKIIEISKDLDITTLDSKHIAIEVQKNNGCPFLIQPELIYLGKKNAYVLSTFVPVTNLAEVIERRKRLNERNARFYGYQIALALNHLHSKGVVYDSLRSENVLLGEDGYVRLDDFGWRRLLSSEKKKLQYMNTQLTNYPWIAEYYSPEHFPNKGVNAASDWWSLGIVIYELLVGITPFHSPVPKNIVQAICNRPLCFPPGLRHHILISDSAKELLNSLLAKLVKDRLGKESISHSFFVTKEWDMSSMLAKKADVMFIAPSKNLCVTKEEDPIQQLSADFSLLEPFKYFNSVSVIRMGMKIESFALPEIIF
eukprot:TRINITY_DN13551_c0_g1_i6.p1 TRINITY_DN13551_c0_g1~~TRINITY_DN13551_c0_g1_i6.p1  ORF type:complete len:497 (-),score=84.63 TRINITY_DN13551_c0_g1_i6:172-1662(-)